METEKHMSVRTIFDCIRYKRLVARIREELSATFSSLKMRFANQYVPTTPKTPARTETRRAEKPLILNIENDRLKSQ